MRVGALEETVTVTGETPTVDIQSATRQRVMDSEVIETIPSGRTTCALGVLIPGVVAQNAGGTLVQDVGGAKIDAALGLAIHGSRQSDQTILFKKNKDTKTISHEEHEVHEAISVLYFVVFVIFVAPTS
jgi:hypothetical protein